MAIVSWIFIFVLCLSKTDYCKARHIGALHKLVTISEDFHYSASKKYASLDQIQMGKTKETTKRSEKIEDNSATTQQGTEKLRISRTTSSIIKHARGKFSGVLIKNKKKNSLVSVSWHVPPKNNLNNKNPSERNPGFYADYSGPRTCPPSHN